MLHIQHSRGNVKTILTLFLAQLCAALPAADRYVSLEGTNDFANKFITWSGAATDIQLAVNSALAGETVWVSNGTYYLTNQVDIASGITLKSFSGTYTNTVINGNNFDGKPVTNRCIYMTHTGAVVEGFTITNGFPGTNNQHGGGVSMTGGILRNCLLTGNNVTNTGGGGGVYANCAVYGIITNCIFIGNCAHKYGGGAYIQNAAQIWNCRFTQNRVLQNTVYNGGGGLLSQQSTGPCINNSTFISNSAAYEGGGFFMLYAAQNSTVRNCLVAQNSAGRGGGMSFFDNGPTKSNTVENCTVVSNRTGGIWRTYAGTSDFFNVIAQSNYSYNFNTDQPFPGFRCYNCCAITNVKMILMNAGNITSSPVFADFNGGNYRLTAESPCINTGLNLPWMYSSTDLDGVSRIDKFSGRADMGCYEHHPMGVMFKVR
ncbi:MAG: right-handed parallel beta-helix repeat-containing protein [Kiritimatiellia bacterium]